MDRADLHIHSTASDGMLSPFEIVDWGIKKGLKAISLTDHDTVSGIKNALKYSKDRGIEVVPGIELSTEYCGVEVHMLGHFLNYNDTSLNIFLDKLKDSRINRAQKMVSKINTLGYNIKFDDLYKRTQDASSIGRPHIARLMVNQGYFKSIADVFEKLIGFGKPAFVERYKVSPFEAVEIILKCGGVPTIAHPGLIINVDIASLIRKLKSWGLGGIEVYHTKHSCKNIEYLNRLAKELDLIPTGGSDCHGVLVDNEPILGSVTVPYENVNRLRYRCRFS